MCWAANVCELKAMSGSRFPPRLHLYLWSGCISWHLLMAATTSPVVHGDTR